MITRELKLAIAHGIRTSDWTLVTDWFRDDGGLTLDASGYRELLVALRDQEFLDSEGSYKAVAVFEYEWARMTDAQKEELLPAVLQAYINSNQWMIWFLAAELLGRFYASGEALECLRALNTTLEGERRELLPMGFEQMARNSSDPEVRTAAFEELQRFFDDPSEAVRDEAMESLSRMGNALLRS